MASPESSEGARQTPRAVLRVVLRAIYHSLRGGSLLHAQAVAYNMFLAFFPALVFLAGVLVYAAPGFEDLLEGLQVVLPPGSRLAVVDRSEEHTSELQSQFHLVCRLLL